MKRKIVFLLIIIGIIGITIWIIKYINDQSPKLAVLKVNGDPTVSIFLDNKHLGRTPYEDKVTEGEYTIKLVPESTTQAYASWQGNIKLTKNLLTYVNAELGESDFNSAIDVLWLEKITGNSAQLSIVTNPDGAPIAIDGDTKGNSPLAISTINPGDHTIAISSAGFAPRTLKVKTPAGYKLIVSVKLALSPADLSSSLNSSQSAESTSSALLIPTPLKIKITPTIKPTPTSKLNPTPTTDNSINFQNIQIKDTPTGFLHVRFSPGLDASISGQVKPGDKFKILDTQNGWYEINYDGINTGWVSGQYVRKIE
jgi:hypothetical protein